jgi:hypothetical protein
MTDMKYRHMSGSGHQCVSCGNDELSALMRNGERGGGVDVLMTGIDERL